MMIAPSVLVLVFLGAFSWSSAAEEPPQAQNSDNKDELNSEAANALLQFIRAVVAEGYSQNKLDTIAEVVEQFKAEVETSNVTLVGYQNIYNEDGSVKEVRTIELSIPTLKRKSSPTIANNNDENEFDMNDLDKIRELSDKITTLSLLQYNMEFTYLKQDEYKNYEEGLYVAKDIIAGKYDGIVFTNQTIYLDNAEQIEADYKQRVPSVLGPIPTSRLAFDKEGKLIVKESSVVGELLATVQSFYETPDDDVIHKSLQSLAEVSLESQSGDDVPKNLIKRLESHFSDLAFTVTAGEPSGLYLNQDFNIVMNYDLVHLQDSLTYSVYGYNRTSA